jgi:hypothetical protein
MLDDEAVVDESQPLCFVPIPVPPRGCLTSAQMIQELGLRRGAVRWQAGGSTDLLICQRVRDGSSDRGEDWGRRIPASPSVLRLEAGDGREPRPGEETRVLRAQIAEDALRIVVPSCVGRFSKPLGDGGYVGLVVPEHLEGILDLSHELPGPEHAYELGVRFLETEGQDAVDGRAGQRSWRLPRSRPGDAGRGLYCFSLIGKYLTASVNSSAESATIPSTTRNSQIDGK